MTKTRFIVVKDVEALQYKSLSNNAIEGVPSMTSLCGMGHRLQLNTLNDLDIKITGMGLAIKKLHLYPGRGKDVRALISQKPTKGGGHIGKTSPAPIIDRRQAGFCGCIVFRVEMSQYSCFSDEEITEAIRSGLLTCRFSGGTFTTGEMVIKKSYKEVLRSVPGNCLWVQDATQCLQCTAKVLEMPNHEAFWHILRKNKESDSLEEAPLKPQGHYIPLAVGYRSLEESPSHQEGARNGNPHVFAEPVMGLGRLRTGFSLRKNEDEAEDLFWHYDNRNPGYYLTTTNN